MSATIHPLSEPSRAGALSLRWIISARDDLVWFVGSVVSSYLLFALYTSGLISLGPMVLLWGVLFDAPHGFGTISRTYLDRSEFRSRKRLLMGSLVFFLVGPAMVLAEAGTLFFVLTGLWAYYHLVKQHYGFMILYKKKNNDVEPLDNKLDRAFLLIVFTCPLVIFFARDPAGYSYVPEFLRTSEVNLATLLIGATMIVGLVWLLRQIQRAMSGLPLNVPKYLLLAAAVPMHWVVLLTPMPQKPVAAAAILTIFHNLQYHRLIWFHNRKYSVGEDRKERYGAAELISRRLLYYVGFALLFGLFCQLPRLYAFAYGESHPLLTQAIIAFGLGAALVHYYLDSKIWRVRRDPEVGRALRME